MPTGKQLLNSESVQAVRAVASIAGLSYRTCGCKRNKMCLAWSGQFGTDLLNVAERHVSRAVGVSGYLIITLLLLAPED